MSLLYLLDTHVVSELARQVPHTGVLKAMAQHEDSCAIASATLEELVCGCARLEDRSRYRSRCRSEPRRQILSVASSPADGLTR